jgi:flagellar basal-body rod protein FlgB
VTLFDSTSLVLQKAMSGAAMRQSVLSSNMANANTPGYVRRDVDFSDQLRDAMADGSDISSVEFSPTVDENAVLRADGNGVDVDAEAAAIAQNELHYESLVSVSAARLDILRYAMGVR